MQKIDFRNIGLGGQEEIEKFTADFLPYSDFSFISLFTYNSGGTVGYSFFRNNLLIKFEDYLTGENFYSLLGRDQLNETVGLLLQQAKENNLKCCLSLVPQSVTDYEPSLRKEFDVVEDMDHFDYVISSQEVAELHPLKLPKKRKLVEDFRKEFPHLKTRSLELTDAKIQQDIIGAFEIWRMSKDVTQHEAEVEYHAIERLLQNAQHFPRLHAIGIYSGPKLIAFNTFEVAGNGYGISSFQKADRQYRGIYAALTHEMAKNMYALGCRWINFEQDLGLEGLRASKSSWHPIKFLKKYKISPRE